MKKKRFLWFEHDVEFSGKSIEQIIHRLDIFVYAGDRDQPTRKSIVQILIVLRTAPPFSPIRFAHLFLLSM